MDSQPFRTELRSRPSTRRTAANIINRAIVCITEFSVLSVSLVDDDTMLTVLKANEDMDPVFAMGMSTYVIGVTPTETHQLYVDYCELVNNSTVISIDKFIEAFENAS